MGQFGFAKTSTLEFFAVLACCFFSNQKKGQKHNIYVQVFWRMWLLEVWWFVRFSFRGSILGRISLVILFFLQVWMAIQWKIRRAVCHGELSPWTFQHTGDLPPRNRFSERDQRISIVGNQRSLLCIFPFVILWICGEYGVIPGITHTFCIHSPLCSVKSRTVSDWTQYGGLKSWICRGVAVATWWTLHHKHNYLDTRLMPTENIQTSSSSSIHVVKQDTLIIGPDWSWYSWSGSLCDWHHSRQNLLSWRRWYGCESQKHKEKASYCLFVFTFVVIPFCFIVADALSTQVSAVSQSLVEHCFGRFRPSVMGAWSIAATVSSHVSPFSNSSWEAERWSEGWLARGGMLYHPWRDAWWQVLCSSLISGIWWQATSEI